MSYISSWSFPGSSSSKVFVAYKCQLQPSRLYWQHDGSLATSDQFQSSNELCLPPIVLYYDLPSHSVKTCLQLLPTNRLPWSTAQCRQLLAIDEFHGIFSLCNWRALHHHAACCLVNIHTPWNLPLSFYGERCYGIRLYWHNELASHMTVTHRKCCAPQ